MSAQISDVLQYGNKDYNIAAIENPGAFFDIAELGLKPTANCSACWRGYVAIFGIDKENRLVLAELHTNNGEEPAPTINGVMPEMLKVDPSKSETFNNLSEHALFGGKWQYFNLNLPVHYSGKLTAADGFIRERYVHMGFHAPASYERVIEFAFEDGILVSENDMSDRAAEKRKDMGDVDYCGGYGEDWIDQTFDMSYESKWA